MSMKAKRVRNLCIKGIFVCMLSLTLAGCNLPTNPGEFIHGRDEDREVATEGSTENEDEPIKKLINYNGAVGVETGSMALDPSAKDFMDQLVSGSFYVIHDGYYYPAFAYASNYDFSDSLKDYIDPYANRQMYFTAENELEIPTLFLAKGDTLVYYDAENILDYVKWERYKDLGYTVGLYNIYQTKYSKLAYIDLEEDEGCIISGSALENINADMISPLVSLIKIGNVDITDELIEDGLIYGAKAGESYDLEVYDGTNYSHYIATADMHAFKAYEMFASIETKPLQQFAWEIEIPDYFVDGYYKVNAICTTTEIYDGLIRIVQEDNFYNDAEHFNEPLLYPYTEQQIAEGDIEEGAFLYQYSNCDDLNKFNTLVVGALGFDDGVKDKDAHEKADILRTANINTFDINFPAGEMCTITITPSQKESGGDAYVLIGDRTTSLTYSAFDNIYTTTIKGDGNTYTLYISGFWNSYDIRLGNCKQDTSGISQSVKTENLTDDTYSLDGYTAEQKNDGKEVLDALNSLNTEDSTEADTFKEQDDTERDGPIDAAGSEDEEISTEVEDE